eukprot:scaffold33811_cov65-Cyclotella_meneghiniana.AAC.1
MTEKYQLKDISKAARICITCIALADQDSKSTSSAMATTDSSVQLVEKEIELSSQQLNYIHKNHHHNEISHSIQQIIHACSTVLDEYAVFGVIRCKRSINDCEGAQEAVGDIGRRYEMGEGEERKEGAVGSSLRNDKSYQTTGGGDEVAAVQEAKDDEEEEARKKLLRKSGSA